MTNSLIRRAIVCAGIVALTISLVGQTATAANPKAGKLPTCMAGDILVSDGTKWVCESDLPRFVDNGDETVTDNATGLMWEMKEDCGGPIMIERHCMENLYIWTTSNGGIAPDGTLYSDFLIEINRGESLSPDGTTITPVVNQETGLVDSYDVTDGASAFSLPNDNFNITSFRSNLVMRWEWSPGSTIFFVWQQNKSGFAPDGSPLEPGSLFDAVTAPGRNIIAIKANYWISMH